MNKPVMKNQTVKIVMLYSILPIILGIQIICLDKIAVLQAQETLNALACKTFSKDIALYILALKTFLFAVNMAIIFACLKIFSKE